MKNKTTSNIYNKLFFTLFLLVFTFSIFAQSKIDSKEIDTAVTENVTTNVANDKDGDGITDQNDLCPTEKGTLKFYGCPKESNAYSWDYFEYQAYPDLENLIVVPPQFSTEEEEVLTKPSHKKGATFEEVEQLFVQKESHSNIEIIPPKYLQSESELIIDELSKRKTVITKYELLKPASSKETVVDEIYDTLRLYKLAEEGDGEIIPAEYTTITKEVLTQPAKVKIVPTINRLIKLRKKNKAFSGKTDAIDQNAQTLDLFKLADQMPYFPDGETALIQYIENNQSYPISAIQNDIQGTVLLEFIVEKDGSIGEIEIAQDIGEGCGKAAKALVTNMPKWNPATLNGKPVATPYILPIDFYINQKPKLPVTNTSKPTDDINKPKTLTEYLDRHQSVAIIPSAVIIHDRKNRKSEPQILQDHSETLQMEIQQMFYDELLKLEEKERLKRVSIQNISITNKLLKDYGITDMDDLANIEPKEIAGILGVDAVLLCETEIDLLMSSGGATALSILDIRVTTNGRSRKIDSPANIYKVKFMVYDGEDGRSIWTGVNDTDSDRSIKKANKVIEKLIQFRLVKNFPYHIRF